MATAVAIERPAPKQTDGQPLFFSNPVAIDISKHQHAGLKQSSSFNFAKNSNSVPIGVFEFPEVARSMPIVFTADDNPTAVAVMGFETNNNFIASDGQWLKGHHIPLYIRKYPFAMFESSETKQFILCVDEDAEHFTAKNPDLPFFEGDKPSQISQQALDMCGYFQQQYGATMGYAKALKDAGLLVAKEVEATLPNGDKTKMGGFMMIDEEKWHNLDDKTYIEWRKKGYVALTHMAVMSQANWKYLAGIGQL